MIITTRNKSVITSTPRTIAAMGVSVEKMELEAEDLRYFYQMADVAPEELKLVLAQLLSRIERLPSDGRGML